MRNSTLPRIRCAPRDVTISLFELRSAQEEVQRVADDDDDRDQHGQQYLSRAQRVRPIVNAYGIAGWRGHRFSARFEFHQLMLNERRDSRAGIPALTSATVEQQTSCQYVRTR